MRASEPLTAGPLIVGLTGGIGMGKSTVAAMFQEENVPVHDADAAVHRLYGPGGAAVERITELFPDAIVEGAVDRARLSRAVLGDGEALRCLEAIVHPLVRAEEARFLREARERNEPVVVLDIPLLFETGGDKRVDRIVTVSAPNAVRRARVLKRPGMTAEKLDSIIARQTPDEEKRSRSHHIIDTGTAIEDTRAAVVALVRRLREEAARSERNAEPSGRASEKRGRE